MNTSQFLKDNRESIISEINREIERITILFDRAKCDLKGAMGIYKNTLEATQNAGKAIEEAKKAIKGGQKMSPYFFISENSLGQLGSSMR